MVNAPVLLTHQGELTSGSGAQPFLMWTVNARGVLADTPQRCDGMTCAISLSS